MNGFQKAKKLIQNVKGKIDKAKIDIAKITRENNALTNVIQNIQRLSKVEIECQISDSLHSVPYTNSDIPMKALAQIMNSQRPFIDRFILAFNIDDIAKEVPSIFDKKAQYKTIQKDVEDFLYAYWIEVMMTNKLKLAELTPNYKRRIKDPFINGYVPLVRSKKLIHAISWRIVDAS